MVQKLKRTADWLEKWSVGAMIVGVFNEGMPVGIAYAVVSMLFSFYFDHVAENFIRKAGEK